MHKLIDKGQCTTIKRKHLHLCKQHLMSEVTGIGDHLKVIISVLYMKYDLLGRFFLLLAHWFYGIILVGLISAHHSQQHLHHNESLLWNDSCESVMMLTKERHGEHKRFDRKHIYLSNRNKIQVNLVEQ